MTSSIRNARLVGKIGGLEGVDHLALEGCFVKDAAALSAALRGLPEGLKSLKVRGLASDGACVVDAGDLPRWLEELVILGCGDALRLAPGSELPHGIRVLVLDQDVEKVVMPIALKKLTLKGGRMPEIRAEEMDWVHLSDVTIIQDDTVCAKDVLLDGCKGGVPSFPPGCRELFVRRMDVAHLGELPSLDRVFLIQCPNLGSIRLPDKRVDVVVKACGEGLALVGGKDGSVLKKDGVKFNAMGGAWVEDDLRFDWIQAPCL
jgi:hypothetical protein